MPRFQIHVAFWLQWSAAHEDGEGVHFAGSGDFMLQLQWSAAHEDGEGAR